MTKKYRLYGACKCFFIYSTVKLPDQFHGSLRLGRSNMQFFCQLFDYVHGFTPLAFTLHFLRRRQPCCAAPNCCLSIIVHTAGLCKLSFFVWTARNFRDKILSLTAKVRRLPLFRRSTGFFGHAKCSYILLLFCLGCPYDFSHIYIR